MTARTPVAGLRQGVAPGGCDDCDAETRTWREPGYPRVWHVTVMHGATCPTYRAMLNRAALRRQRRGQR
jgi:hypothetical protein